MNSPEKILADISSLTIQGAINIARAGLSALYQQSNTVSPEEVAAFAKRLVAARSTEPALRNMVRAYLSNYQDLSKESRAARYQKLSDYFEKAEAQIIEYGAALLPDHARIYTHCHSSTVVKIILRASKQGKHLTVYNTETRPKYQGRLTATELAQHGVDVIHMVDSAASFAIEQCDFFLFGADAVSSVGHVYNKVGTKLFAHYAMNLGKKVYSCTQSIKFDPETIFGQSEPIEIRADSEVWPEENEPHIMIYNPAFDEVPAHLITGIISELGVYAPSTFIEEAHLAIKEL